MVTFKTARLKIERAKKHIGDIQTFVAALPDRYTATIERNPTLGNPVIKHDLQGRNTIATDLAVIIGDAVHNLNCALDYAWGEAVKSLAPAAATNFTKFPVHPTAKQLESVLLETEINVAPELIRFVVSEVQAYDGGNHSIWPIHTLDIDDKHRLLIPTLQMASITGIELENERGETQHGFAWPTTQEPPYFVPIEAGWHIKNKGQISVSVIFDGAPMLYGMDVTDMLWTFVIQTIDVINRMENL